MGVAPEQLPRLFQRCGRSSDGASRLGGGLGLAICKGLVEAHGGRIRAEGRGVGQQNNRTVPFVANTRTERARSARVVRHGQPPGEAHISRH